MSQDLDRTVDIHLDALQDPTQTLEIPPRKWGRKHFLFIAGLVGLVVLAVVVILLVIPEEPTTTIPIPTILIPKVLIPKVSVPVVTPIEEVEETKEKKSKSTDPIEKITLKIYFNPSKEKIEAGLKLVFFEKEIVIKKDLDFKLLQELVKYIE